MCVTLSDVATVQAIILLQRHGYRVTSSSDDGATLVRPLTRGRRPGWTTARPKVESIEVTR